MNKKYYIKFKNMYLKSIYTDIDYPDNNFISQVEFSMSKNYCDTYRKEQAELLRDKLHDIGFELNMSYIEEEKEEKEEVKD